jgi:uncharacterized RDD family membrane protein YckC
MTIQNLNGRSPDSLKQALQNGSKAVFFMYTISFIVMTLRRNSGIYILEQGEDHWKYSWKYSLISFLLGWWGLPWGFIYTPQALYVNAIDGGKDVTDALLQDLGGGTIQQTRFGARSGYQEGILDSGLDASMPNWVYASFGKRAGALIIDGILLAIVQQLMVWVGSLVIGFSMLQPPAAFSILSVVLSIGYYAYMESSETQATIGKMALGIIVTDMDGERLTFQQAAIRSVSRLVSAITLCIGYLIQLFTEQKQTLHDLIAKTLVYEKPA